MARDHLRRAWCSPQGSTGATPELPHCPAAEGASAMAWSFCGSCLQPHRVMDRSPEDCPRLAAKWDR